MLPSAPGQWPTQSPAAVLANGGGRAVPFAATPSFVVVAAATTTNRPGKTKSRTCQGHSQMMPVTRREALGRYRLPSERIQPMSSRFLGHPAPSWRRLATAAAAGAVLAAMVSPAAAQAG